MMCDRNDAYPSVVESDEKRIVINSSKEGCDHDAVTDLDEDNEECAELHKKR